MRRVWVALTCLSAFQLPAAAGAASRYASEKYGWSFALPKKANVCRLAPPSPNHGLLFRPPGVTSPPCDDDIDDGDRYTSADARFDVDRSVTPANFVQTLCHDIAIGEDGQVSAATPLFRPAGAIWSACRITSNGHVEELLFGQRNRNAAPAIDYVLTLRTTVDDYDQDRAAFTRWLRSVRLRSIR